MLELDKGPSVRVNKLSDELCSALYRPALLCKSAA